MERKFVNGEHWYLIRDIMDPELPHKFEISSSTSSDWSPWYIHDKWDDMEKWLLSRGYTGDFTYQPGTVHIQPTYGTSPVAQIMPWKGWIPTYYYGSVVNQLIPIQGEANRLASIVNGGCQHEWATYTGFIKVEVYCIKCKETRK